MPRYKSVHTGPQIDSGVARALPGGEIDQLRSNHNLLDNWDFRNPVNQRGITTATTDIFLIDRWKVYASGTATTSSGGIVFSNIIDFGTQVEISRIPLNVPITLSVLTNIGLKSVTHTFSGTLNETVSQAIGNGIVVNAIYNWANSGTFLFCLQGYSVTAQAVKLELGSVSTLANDPPADCGEELRSCQRYFQRLSGDSEWSCIGFSATDGSTNATLFILLATPMRSRPVVTFNNLYIGGVPITSIALDQYNPTILKYNAILSSPVVPGMYPILQGGSGYVDASADF